MKQSPAPNHRLSLGKYGEDLAVLYLQKKGYSIIDRNFKAQYGEIDIIGQIHTILVFVEVKTRISDQYGLPEEAVNSRKIHEIIKTAQYYCSLHPNLPKEQRIDCIAIEVYSDKKIKALRHIENITQ